MVSVRKRGKVYEYRIEIATIDGTRKWITKSGFPTKQLALKEGAIAYNDYYKIGKKQQLKDMSYSDFLDYWINTYCNFNLKDQFDQQYFIYQNFNKFACIKNFDSFISTGTFWDKCETIMKYLNRLEEELIDYNDLIKSSNKAFNFYGRLMQVYEHLRIENNFLDFSSIQTETYKLLVNNPGILKQIQDSIDFVMIDEYQDTNHIQEKLAFLFSSKNHNLCVVGDDDQAIYRFRGATVRNILEFPNHFKNCKQVKLTENYRSHKDIVNFYNDWMDSTKGRDFDWNWGKFRYLKTIVPAKKTDCDEPSVIQCSTKEENYINTKVLDLIHELIDSKKISDKDIMEIGEALSKKFFISKLTLPNDKYNEMISTGENLNSLKAKMHNRALLNLYKKFPDTKNIFVDQFVKPETYFKYLNDANEPQIRNITFRTKGESYFPCVALASVMARYSFLLEKEKLESKYGIKFPFGASNKVDEFAVKFIKKFGLQEFNKIAKKNFANYSEAISNL